MMKKKSFQVKPIVLLAASAVLLLSSTVGSTQAALTYYSENYSVEVTVSNIGTTLVENGEDISRRNYLEDDKWDETTGTLLSDMLAEDEELVLGRQYREELSVKNSGAIDAYVRVILTRSWRGADGKKDVSLAPELINLNLVTGDNGWIVDEEASTAERIVLYYTNILPTEESTPIFTDYVSVDPAVGTKVVETVTTEEIDGRKYKTITYEYEYDGYTFYVEAEVNAVQTHNAQQAIKSAWGVDVSVAEDGSLSLQ